jgi:two-component system, NarL family, nitrate/nitrite response regulator NarL
MQSTDSAKGETIRVLVADDTQIHTQLLADALRRDLQFEVINAPARTCDLVETVKLQRVNVVVLSSNLDEEPFRGFEVLRELRASDPGVLAVMLLDSSKRESILRAFRAGARGIFSREDSVETLSKCIRSVSAGQIWANSEQMSFAVESLASSPVLRAVDGKGLSLLSKREMDVVRSLAEGLTNREIAERLGLSPHTIKNYLFRVYDKLGVSNRLELLFMTLTQASAPQFMASPHSSDVSTKEHQAKPGTMPSGVRPKPTRQGEESQLRFGMTSTRVRAEFGRSLREGETGSANSPALVGADPLD